MWRWLSGVGGDYCRACILVSYLCLSVSYKCTLYDYLVSSGLVLFVVDGICVDVCHSISDLITEVMGHCNSKVSVF